MINKAKTDGLQKRRIFICHKKRLVDTFLLESFPNAIGAIAFDGYMPTVSDGWNVDEWDENQHLIPIHQCTKNKWKCTYRQMRLLRLAVARVELQMVRKKDLLIKNTLDLLLSVDSSEVLEEDSQDRLFKPIASKELIKKVRAGFVYQGKTLHSWCAENNVQYSNARQALIGSWSGVKGEALLLRIVKAANEGDQNDRTI